MCPQGIWQKKKKISGKNKTPTIQACFKKNQEKWDLEQKLNYDKRKDNIVNLINLNKINYRGLQ